MNTVQITLYDLFRKELHLADDKAAELISAFEKFNELKADKNSVSTKEDIYLLREEIHKLELKIETNKSDIYKAIFWTSLIQLLAILGGVLAIFKFMLK